MKKMQAYTFRISFLLMGCLSFLNVSGQDLQKHQWSERVLIIKTTEQSSIEFLKQLQEFFNSTEELTERKLVLYKVRGNTYELIDFKDETPKISGTLSNYVSEQILNPDENFEIILIGLDGGVKLQQVAILTKKALFSLIDSMPMRRAEMRRKKKSN